MKIKNLHRKNPALLLKLKVMNYSYYVGSNHESNLWVWLVFVLFFTQFDSSFKCTRSSTPAESEKQ